MRLRILLPSMVLADTPARKVTAHGLHGSFTLLPRHVDFLAALVPGLLAYEPPDSPDSTEVFAAVDGGLLVKYGPDVFVSTSRAVVDKDLATLRQTIDREFLAIDERERATRGVMARLEADFIRRFLELGDRARG
jgi:F-type H+-transporting ATPase subunit epsilon